MEQPTNVLSSEAHELRLKGIECPLCGRLYDDHVRGECPENIKQQLELASRVLARYNQTSSQMKMNLDIAKLEHLMARYKNRHYGAV